MIYTYIWIYIHTPKIANTSYVPFARIHTYTTYWTRAHKSAVLTSKANRMVLTSVLLIVTTTQLSNIAWRWLVKFYILHTKPFFSITNIYLYFFNFYILIKCYSITHRFLVSILCWYWWPNGPLSNYYVRHAYCDRWLFISTHTKIFWSFSFFLFSSLVNFRFQNFLDFFSFIFKIHSKEYCSSFVALKVTLQFVSIISISVYEYTLLFNLQILNKNILIKFLIKWIYIYLVYFAPAPSTASLSRRSDKYTM